MNMVGMSGRCLHIFSKSSTGLKGKKSFLGEFDMVILVYLCVTASFSFLYIMKCGLSICFCATTKEKIEKSVPCNVKFRIMIFTLLIVLLI